MLSVVILRAPMLSVVVLNVVAPSRWVIGLNGKYLRMLKDVFS